MANHRHVTRYLALEGYFVKCNVAKEKGLGFPSS